MSPEERAAAARSKAIRDKHVARMAKRRKVTPNALRKFEEQIKDYPLQGKAAWLDRYRWVLRDFVVIAFEDGAETIHEVWSAPRRLIFEGEELTQPQRDQLMRVCVDWLRKLKKLSLVRLSKQLNGPSAKPETYHPLDKYKPL